MKRLSLCLASLKWGARLQLLAVALILSWYAWIDWELGIWPVSIGLILFACVAGRILLPLMMKFPRQSYKVWSTFGLAFLITYVLARDQWWWRTVAAHFGREFFMWLDLSCGYWFISELRMNQEKRLELIRSAHHEISESKEHTRAESSKDSFEN